MEKFTIAKRKKRLKEASEAEAVNTASEAIDFTDGDVSVALIEGQVVQFNFGTMWMDGEILKFKPTRAFLKELRFQILIQSGNYTLQGLKM